MSSTRIGQSGYRAEMDAAERAYVTACELEPTNAEILWARAENLERLGQVEPARGLYRRIADGTWQPRFQAVQERARQRLAPLDASPASDDWRRARWR